ncbi:MAG: aminopeptidase [Candidatus Nanohaloarchaea archaeon]
MSLRAGAETIVEQCLDVKPGEKVVVVNDGNDPELIDAVLEVLDETGCKHELMEYPEPENHGTEPPEDVAEAMRDADVFIAPTKKSLSHTQAREEACEAATRGATLPGINREIWNSSLQADYSRVEEITEKVYSMLEETSEVRVKTPSGTDFTFEVDFDSFFTDTGMIEDPGEFGNLPAGEAHGGVRNGSGTIVIDHFPFAPSGTEVRVEDSRVVDIEEAGSSELGRKIADSECVRNIAEFGFGTNPEAKLIGNTLQDEKVFGTVHIAFGDNTHYFSSGERRTECDIHWDTVCEDPTVWFDDQKVLDEGKPVFMD